MLKSLMTAVSLLILSASAGTTHSGDTTQRIGHETSSDREAEINRKLDELEKRMDEEHERWNRERALKERSQRITRLQDHPHFKGWMERRRAAGIPDGCNKRNRCENGDRWH